jgi:hypothetical protein
VVFHRRHVCIDRQRAAISARLIDSSANPIEAAHIPTFPGIPASLPCLAVRSFTTVDMDADRIPGRMRA